MYVFDIIYRVRILQSNFHFKKIVYFSRNQKLFDLPTKLRHCIFSPLNQTPSALKPGHSTDFQSKPIKRHRHIGVQHTISHCPKLAVHFIKQTIRSVNMFICFGFLIIHARIYMIKFEGSVYSGLALISSLGYK